MDRPGSAGAPSLRVDGDALGGPRPNRWTRNITDSNDGRFQSVPVDAGGAAYMDIGLPAGTVFLDVDATASSGANLDALKAEAVVWKTHPDTCQGGNPLPLDGDGVGFVAVSVAAGCESLTVIASHDDPTLRGNVRVDVTARLEPAEPAVSRLVSLDTTDAPTAAVPGRFALSGDGGAAGWTATPPGGGTELFRRDLDTQHHHPCGVAPDGSSPGWFYGSVKDLDRTGRRVLFEGSAGDHLAHDDSDAVYSPDANLYVLDTLKRPGFEEAWFSGFRLWASGCYVCSSWSRARRVGRRRGPRGDRCWL